MKRFGAGTPAKKRTSMRLIGAAVLLVVGCGGDRGVGVPSGSGAVVRDSAGIRIVENAGVDVPYPGSVERLVDLAPDDDALTPVPWGVAADPVSGRIFAADWTGTRVAVFERTGAYVGSLGRAGDGPGEFRSPSAVFLGPDRVLSVWDARRSVLSRWSTDGEQLGEERVDIQYWGPGVALEGDGLVTVVAERDPTGAAMTQRLVVVAPGGRATLHEVRVALEMMQLPGANLPAPRVFSPSVAWTGDGERTYVLKGPDYRIDVYEGGEPVSSIRRDVPPIPVTRSMAVAAVESGPGPYAGFVRRTGLTPDQIVNAVGHEPEISAVLAIAVDPERRLWVTRTADGLRPGRVDVFDAVGGYIGTLEATGIPVAFLSDAEFVSLRIEESGLPVLGVARLLPPESGAVREFRDCADCPVMVELPPGRFLMGSPAHEESAARLGNRPEWTVLAEKPQVEVEIAYPFAIGKYEVTFDEWDRCVDAGGCSYRPDDGGRGRGNRPVIRVSRDDAYEYIRWLERRTGRPYRLPSEAEWEYAARGGTTTARHWGDELGGAMAVCDRCGSLWDERSTAPVGSFPPNPFGLHDMLGNVSEWVADCWHPNHEGGPNDGSPRIVTSPWWKDGACERPVFRGGAWDYFAWTVRAAKRGYWWPGPWTQRDSSSRGFRVALSEAANAGEAAAAARSAVPGSLP